MNKTYVFKILIALDMLAAVILFRDADVTISSMTGLVMRGANPPLWAKLLHGVLNSISSGHCEQAIVNDAARAKAALQLLGGSGD